jgi:hypothetical protein
MATKTRRKGKGTMVRLYLTQATGDALDLIYKKLATVHREATAKRQLVETLIQWVAGLPAEALDVLHGGFVHFASAGNLKRDRNIPWLDWPTDRALREVVLVATLLDDTDLEYVRQYALKLALLNRNVETDPEAEAEATAKVKAAAEAALQDQGRTEGA